MTTPMTNAPDIGVLERPQCYEFALDFLGGSDATALNTYIETLEQRLRMAEAALRAQGEVFGYFRALPFGWEQCSETDEGAVALYTHPQGEEHGN